MRTLIFGRDGQVGKALTAKLTASTDVTSLGRADADLAEPGAAARIIRTVRPELVINAAAYTAVDRAESERDLAVRINADAVGEIAQAVAAVDGWLIHYSTDYVFAGDASRPYAEDAPTAPLNTYGLSKVLGEQLVASSGCRHRILRTSWVYSATGRNFLLTILRLANQGLELKIVDDQVGAPTSALAVATATVQIARDLAASRIDGGTLHVSCQGQTTWAGFARAIVDEGARRGLCPPCAVSGIPSHAYPTPALRPMWSVLSGARLQRDHGILMPDWKAALNQCLDQMAA